MKDETRINKIIPTLKFLLKKKSKIKKIYLNDASPVAVKNIRQNFKLNKISKTKTIISKEAKKVS